MIDLLDGDTELFERVREALILDGVADDKKGVGLDLPQPAATSRRLAHSQAATADFPEPGTPVIQRSGEGPIGYEHDVECHLPRFTGRTWLFRRIDDWLSACAAAPRR